jgi:hypothetical protein
MIRALLLFCLSLVSATAIAQPAVQHVQIKAQASAPTRPAPGRYRLWVDSSGPTLKLLKPDGTTVSYAAGGGSCALASCYSAGVDQDDSTILLDSTRLGIRIRDNPTPISGALFAVQNSVGTDYLSLAVAGLDAAVFLRYIGTQATVPPTITWTAATYQNSWVSFNAGTHYVAEYYKDALGWVHIRGTISTGTTGTVAFTLPVGFRPTKAMNFPITTSGGHGFMGIATNGEATIVAVTGNASTFSAIDGIRLYAEQ